MMHNIQLSDNGLRFINKVVPSLMLRPDNQDFLPDAEAIAEILKATQSEESNAPSSVQQ